jgi:hypothetical protein
MKDVVRDRKPYAERFLKTLFALSRCRIAENEVPETCSPDCRCTPTNGMKYVRGVRRVMYLLYPAPDFWRTIHAHVACARPSPEARARARARARRGERASACSSFFLSPTLARAWRASNYLSWISSTSTSKVGLNCCHAHLH